MRAVAAASLRSASRTSGLRFNSAAPSPTGISAARCGGVTQASTSAGACEGVRPSRAVSWNTAARLCPSSGGMAERPALAAAAPAPRRTASPAPTSCRWAMIRVLAVDHLQRAPGDSQLLAERAGLGVGPRRFRGHGDLDAVARGDRRRGVGARGLHRAADVTEQVELVRDVEQVVEQPDGLRRTPGEFQDLVGGGIAAINAAQFGPGLRIKPVAGCLQRGAGDREVGLGHRQIGVGRERLLLQPLQLRIVVKPPPVVWRSSTLSAAGFTDTSGASAPVGFGGGV